jgi:hypothetical protein
MRNFLIAIPAQNPAPDKPVSGCGHTDFGRRSQFNKLYENGTRLACD